MTADLPSLPLEQDTTIGSLCTGYAGLDMGVAAAVGGNARLLWAADHDPHISRLLAQRFPGTPNLGGLAAVHWAHVPRPDVITAGFPCQDISPAGRGAGIEKGEHSSVWHHVMDAVRRLRPDLLVLENVAALRWKGRGFDRVLADLARAGYDARWCSVRAIDAGACHRRERVFVAAHPTRQRRSNQSVQREPVRRHGCVARTTGGRCALACAPHPRVRNHPHCGNHNPQAQRQHVSAHAPRQRLCEGQPDPVGFTRSPQSALRGHWYASRQHGPRAVYTAPPFAYAWGQYEPAIRRWEAVLGRAAPPPTEAGIRRQPRMSSELVEWMVGLPEGWVTDPDLGLPRTAQLQALGNGVVPQQAARAVRHRSPTMPMPSHPASAGEPEMKPCASASVLGAACRDTRSRAAAQSRSAR
ncbi:DNA cytosine methyltransferase [Nocardiopsis sp. YSL2]|uniref:DNA cytosine methyltransferase n=1 Tax=Nocardiopsis sp. YSL2 TaxID=2939492 RepID=UPI0026F44236|nr:DNA cytosine methyltransferase [Nocardiopsis sp. YSL2]